MVKPAKKTVVLLNEDLPPGVAMNTAVHMAHQAGAVRPEIAGGAVKDSCGREHSGIPMSPNVVLAISEQNLKEVVDQGYTLATEHPDVLVVDYPEQGFLTTTDEEFRDALAVISTESIRYYGCLVHGPRRLIDQLTKQQSTTLWGRHLDVPRPNSES